MDERFSTSGCCSATLEVGTSVDEGIECNLNALPSRLSFCRAM
jgi:hypothetical protein